MKRMRECTVGISLTIALTLLGCDGEQPPASPTRSEPTVRSEPTAAPKAEATANDAPTNFDDARKQIEELEKSLPPIEAIIASQSPGSDGLKAIGDKMLELGQAGDLQKMQALFKNFKAPQPELTELFGQAEADNQWPSYARNSSGFVTAAEKLTADIKAGRYDQVMVVELQAGDKLPPAVERMLAALGGKTPVYELSLVNSQKPKDKKIYRPMVFVNGQWRHLMNVFTSMASPTSQNHGGKSSTKK